MIDHNGRTTRPGRADNAIEGDHGPRPFAKLAYHRRVCTPATVRTLAHGAQRASGRTRPSLRGPQ